MPAWSAMTSRTATARNPWMSPRNGCSAVTPNGPRPAAEVSPRCFRQHVAPPLIAQDWAPAVVTAASSLPKTCLDYHASFVAGWIEPVGSEPGGASVARERANDSGREAIVADRTSRGRFLGQVLDDDGSCP